MRYNVASGVLLGAKASGQYAGRKKQFMLGLWYAPGLESRYTPAQQLQYQAEFKHQTRGGGTYYYQSLLYNEINTHEMGWFNRLGKTEYGLYGKSMQRYHRLQYNIDHPLYNPGSIARHLVATLISLKEINWMDFFQRPTNGVI